MPTFTGDQSANTLAGSASADTMSGLGGADTLNGGGGNDTLYGHSAGASSAINVSVFASGFAQPVAAASTAADPGFLYVVEKASGVIWRVDASSGSRTAFLDIPNAQFLADGERGVLGLALHPDYESNGRFFVCLTDAQGDIQVREYTRSADPAVANTSFSVVIEIPKQTGFSNHNGGWIGFSPEDGHLYIATGDGGGGGDPGNRAQNLNDLLGKILRIDVDADDFPTDDVRNYAIPDDNPFVGVAGADEIWMSGVRNPWRNAFDPRNGDFYIADVGQGEREEVNFFAAGTGAGANLGWRIMEGSLPFNPGPPGTPQPGDPALTLPVFEYDHDLGISITGGEVYVGAAASFVGQYVFADFGSNRLWTYSAETGGVLRSPQLTGASLSSVVEFVTGADGALYAIGIGGTIWRITPGAGSEDVADVLNGGGGADRLVGHAGNDVLDGGVGADTATYASASTAASWARTPDGAWIVTSGVEGVDTLTTVEFLDFTDRDVFLDRAAQTFSGDGTSDMLFRRDDGVIVGWDVAGTAIDSASVFAVVGDEWTALGAGDFNGDSRDDIAWRHDNGAVLTWHMNGAAIASAAFVASIGAEWSLLAIADLDGDTRDDMIWRSEAGAVLAWRMDEREIESAAVVASVGDEWALAGDGDFNGDGQADFVWRRDDGYTLIWQMDRAAIESAYAPSVQVGEEWSVVGAGDANNDGYDDLFWRHDNGAVVVWLMQNGAVASSGVLGAADPVEWQVMAVGDYNGDGRDDLLFQNTSGTVFAWMLDGASIESAGAIATIGDEWGFI
ncbi:MAG TPA: PQQ-dependent sugar dehydrogenase [Vitreimonas sp.]|uniref:PQQ-dependent sugar dehydrogenase n=1 Tax=Vitreimonas sp. TaxID=3069702 RepID=UPI002D62A791|nr:PQQ-dependent sugar dehydrogenase [Vitreimonas sp.]HYD86448.1 PQQ-dependent sugar dehydrogenase [Vitreimonas sp.]